MNFFELQQRARRHTTIAVLLFVAATLAIVAVTDAVVLGALASLNVDPYQPPSAYLAWIGARPELLAWSSAGVAALIAGATLFRLASLSGGGGTVAQSLGGTLLDSSARDPHRRQLLNIVEEMAIASGLPVPAVYVLENEGGINAFAAGFSPADAAIGVTRGTLEVLTRDELQGVIAHEFSHILNGDMRLNTRLIGVTFGILVIALVGRAILRGISGRRRGSGRDQGKAVAVALAVGMALVLIGYIGVFFARLIKATVSRQREWLADASAVQFTRNPAGIAGALKKIAVSPLRAVIVNAESEEVNHMLIAEKVSWLGKAFASHPPIIERIRAIEPSFDVAELESIRLEPIVDVPPAPAPEPETPAMLAKLLPLTVIASIGAPGTSQLEVARTQHAGIPEPLKDAAHSTTDALAVVFALVLSKDELVRERQIARIRERGNLTDAQALRLEAIANHVERLEEPLRLPLLEVTFPVIRRRPQEDLRTLVKLVDELLAMDGSLALLDYTLARLLRAQVAEALDPRRHDRIRHHPKLIKLAPEVQVLFSVVARAGHDGQKPAQAAFLAGTQRLYPGKTLEYLPDVDWTTALDRALYRLDLLKPLVKEELIGALVVTIAHDRRLTLGESELLRVVCASLHCPLPPLVAQRSTQGTGH